MKFFNARVWLIIFGVMGLLGGVLNAIGAESVALSEWGDLDGQALVGRWAGNDDPVVYQLSQQRYDKLLTERTSNALWPSVCSHRAKRLHSVP